MNDFLQGLRSNYAEKQRTVMTRKNYDAAYSNPNQQYPYAGRPAHPYYEGNQMPAESMDSSSRLQEVIDNLNSHMETLVDNQKYLIHAQKRSADMLERQVTAIERILDHLNIKSVSL